MNAVQIEALAKVWEIRAADLSISPVHTSAFGVKAELDLPASYVSHESHQSSVLYMPWVDGHCLNAGKLVNLYSLSSVFCVFTQHFRRCHDAQRVTFAHRGFRPCAIQPAIGWKFWCAVPSSFLAFAFSITVDNLDTHRRPMATLLMSKSQR